MVGILKQRHSAIVQKGRLAVPGDGPVGIEVDVVKVKAGAAGALPVEGLGCPSCHALPEHAPFCFPRRNVLLLPPWQTARVSMPSLTSDNTVLWIDGARQRAASVENEREYATVKVDPRAQGRTRFSFSASAASWLPLIIDYEHPIAWAACG